MVLYIMKKALAKLAEKPFLLWGLSLLYGLTAAILTAAFGILPIIGVALVLVLNYGVKMIYLNAVNDKKYNEDQLFAGFHDFKRVFSAMAIKELWLTLWSFVPVMNIIKGYQYSFVPYILATDPEVTMGQALDISKEKTKGFKHVMFWSDVLLVVIPLAVTLVLGLLGTIPYIGGLFIFIMALFLVVYFLVLPLVSGLIHAYIWQEEENPSYVAPQPQQPVYPQQQPQYAPYGQQPGQYPQQPGQYPQYPQQGQYPQQPYPQQPYQQPYPQQPYNYAPYAAPEAPAYTAPVMDTPVPEAPVFTAPQEEAPIPEAPVFAAPEEPAPAPEAPVEEAPVEEAPAAPAEPSGSFCPSCGAPVNPGTLFCGACGYKLN